MINRLLVESRLDYIRQCVQDLEELARFPREVFLGDRTKTGAAESFLRRALEAVFDIGRHILAKQGAVDLAMEYRSIARGLGQKGIVNSELAERLVKAASYRNRMVHLYHLISDEELFEIITHDLEDLRSFARQVRGFLDSSRETSP